MEWGNLAANERVLIVSAAARCHDECGMLATAVEQSSIERRRSMAQGSRGKYTAARRLAHVGCCVRAIVVVDMVDASSSRLLC